MSFVDPPQVPIPTTGVPGVGLSPQLTGSTNPHTEVSFGYFYWLPGLLSGWLSQG